MLNFANEFAEKIFKLRYAYDENESWEQACMRVAEHVARGEEDPKKFAKYTDEFYNELLDGKFMPGGRIWYGSGRNKAQLLNCVSGDTLIHTKNGMYPAADLAGKEVEVLSKGGIYRKAKWSNFGKQELFKILLSNGDELFATAGHEWVVIKKDRHGYERVTTIELANRRIPMQHVASFEYDDEQFEEGVRHGLTFGDGSLYMDGRYSLLPQFGDSKHLVTDFFKSHSEWPSINATVATKLPKKYKTLPEMNENASYVRGFIAGFIGADGCVDFRGHIMAHQANFENLVKIRRLAASVGLPSLTIKKVREFNPFNGSEAPLYKLTFVKQGFDEKMFVKNKHKEYFRTCVKSTKQQNIKVESVVSTFKTEDVFCCVEPETHTFVIEAGYLTGNCFVLGGTPEDDSREGWGKLLHDSLIISGTGGGIGINFSDIRPRGTPIIGTGGEATGSVSFMRIVNSVCEEIKAGGQRRSALMFCLNHDHPDVIEFLNAKLDLGQINNANISVVFMNEDPEDFFEKVKNDQDHDLMWKGKVVKTIKAKELWEKLIQNALKNGEPGILNFHLFNKMNNIPYARKLVATNPCFPASERLLTENGYQTFGELYAQGLPVSVLSDKRVTYNHDDTGVQKLENFRIDSTSVSSMVLKNASRVALTQQNAKILNLKFSNGSFLRCTPNHAIATHRGMVEAQKLRKKDKILIAAPHPKQSIIRKLPETLEEKEAFLMGMLAGDGTFGDSDEACIDLWGDDRERMTSIIEPMFNEVCEQEYDRSDFYKRANWGTTRTFASAYVIQIPNAKKTRISSRHLGRLLKAKYRFEKATKGSVPEFIIKNARNTSAQFYLAAFFYCDGTVNCADKDTCDIRLAQSNEPILRQIQLLLNANGICSKIFLRRKAGERMMPDGRGGSKLYPHKAQYELIVNLFRVNFINTIGFFNSYKDAKAQSHATFMKTTKTVKQEVLLVEINEELNVEDVYCLNEPVNHNITVNSILLSNCGEIGLTTNGNCCLGAVVLPRFVKQDSKAKNANDRFDWEGLHTTVGRGIRFLDNVLTVNHYPIPETELEAKAIRRLGLGVMGLHDMLLMLGLKYSSEEGRAFVSKIMSFIKHAAYDTSTYLALEKGPFPEFDAQKVCNSGFVKTLKPSVRNKIRDYGLRNCAVMTIAPTGTTSIVQGVTSGIEPIFASAYNRKFQVTNEDGYRELKSEVVVHPLFEEFVNKNLDISHFESSEEISPADHFAMQVVCQEHVDNAISKTVNIPQEKYTPELLGELYMKFVPKLKGTTIYPVGSRKDAPLSPIPTEDAFKLVKNKSVVHEEEAVDMCVSGVCGL